MQVQMPILTDVDCKSKFGTNLVPDTQVCAGVSGAGLDTCQGDSGGPLVVKHDDGFWYLMGLTSWVSDQFRWSHEDVNGVLDP